MCTYNYCVVSVVKSKQLWIFYNINSNHPLCFCSFALWPGCVECLDDPTHCLNVVWGSCWCLLSDRACGALAPACWMSTSRNAIMHCCQLQRHSRSFTHWKKRLSVIHKLSSSFTTERTSIGLWLPNVHVDYYNKGFGYINGRVRSQQVNGHLKATVKGGFW